jgi:hypothetical protein
MKEKRAFKKEEREGSTKQRKNKIFAIVTII